MIDTHTHAFDSIGQGVSYTLDHLVPIDQYMTQLEAYGIQSAVLVQPSFLGFDNSYLVECLKLYPDRLRGVVVLPSDTSFEALKALDEVGVRGMRLNLFHSFDEALDMTHYSRLFEQMYQLGWHIELYATRENILPLLHKISTQVSVSKKMRVVIDHFGMPNDLDDEDFQRLLQYPLDTYIKLSAPYRFECDNIPKAIETIITNRGSDKVLWGSDYPFTRFEDTFNYEKALAFIQDTPIPNFTQILTKNAQQVFTF